ncbi:MAG: TerD family protein [Prevotella sp.]|nr:TerD family protein [Prevotella sp.]
MQNSKTKNKNIMCEKRFELEKGDRFILKKSEGLANLTIELGWTVPEKYRNKEDAPDPDACTFLLGEEGIIINDGGFVYYRSNCREEPFSREKYSNKRNWREKTYPVSPDGSVKGPHDDRGTDDDNSGQGNENIIVDLNKVDPKITELVFCAAMYNHDKYTFGDVEDLYISITNDANSEELCRYNLKDYFKTETAIVAGRMLCDEEGEWSFEAVGKSYTGGMQTLIDIYA